MALNKKRRHLSPSQNAAVAVDMVPLLAAEAAKRKSEGQKKGGETAGRGRPKQPDSSSASLRSSKPPEEGKRSPGKAEGKATQQAARMVGAGSRSVEAAKAIKEKDPALFEKVKAGEVTVNRAAQEIRKREEPPPAPPRYPHSDRLIRWLKAVTDETNYIKVELGGIKALVAEPAKWDRNEVRGYILPMLDAVGDTIRHFAEEIGNALGQGDG